MSTLQQRWGIRQYEQLEWRSNSFLQLQRLAHEALGFGTWSRADDHVPTTEPMELLGQLNVSNPKHPVLMSPSGHEMTTAPGLTTGRALVPKIQTHDVSVLAVTPESPLAFRTSAEAAPLTTLATGQSFTSTNTRQQSTSGTSPTADSPAVSPALVPNDNTHQADVA
jgi:hypothetical protein